MALNAKWCIRTIFERYFGVAEQVWNQGRYMVQWTEAIRNDVLEVWAAEKIKKAMTRNGSFWPSLKQCLGSWNCREKLKARGKMVHCDTSWTDALEVGTAENIFKQ